MNTKNVTNEQISAFSDGEAEGQSEVIMASLRQPEGRAAWDLYHQIGDVLRSEEMGLSMSPDFASRLVARLEAEPAIVAPASRSARVGQSEVSDDVAGRPLRRFAMAGVAAAVVTAAFVAVPQMMVAMKGSSGSPVMVAEAGRNPALAQGANQTSQAPLSTDVVAVNVQQGVVLRDPRIDDYLLAHQRFSPSVYSTAQYARSAAFSNESGK